MLVRVQLNENHVHHLSATFDERGCLALPMDLARNRVRDVERHHRVVLIVDDCLQFALTVRLPGIEVVLPAVAEELSGDAHEPEGLHRRIRGGDLLQPDRVEALAHVHE